jgi:hypothetical protein
MAGEEFQPLLRVGPFRKFDTKNAQVYQRDQSGIDSTAIALSNADTSRNLGSLMNAFGRNAFQQFPPVSGSITNVIRYDVSPTRPYWIVEDTIGQNFAFDYNNDLISNIPAPSGNLWTQAVQSNGNVFFNSGVQAFVVHNQGYPGQPKQSVETAEWQYPAPSQAIYGYGVSKVSDSPGLAQGTYDYAFAQVIHLPAVGGDIIQTTAVTGGNSPYPYQTNISKSEAGNTANELIGLFSGLTAEGYAYKTAIYRMSSNVPVWYQVAIVSGSVYVDNATDASISANPQMSFAGQQPPTGFGSTSPSGFASLAPIASHQDRMWVMAIVNDTATNHQPQTQVWYSNEGQPWNFDATNQVLLLNDQQTNPLQTGAGTIPLPYGQNPVAMVSLGSILICWLSNQTWFINGSDETTYQPLQLFPDIGLIAPNGYCVGGGMAAWLSAQGIWTYDGANLTYISNDIYNELQEMGPVSLTTCAAAYADENFYFSFPVSGSTGGVTWRYYLPAQEWTMLPYASPSFAADTQVGSNPNYLDSFKLNQLVAVRNGTDWLDAWLDGKENDLGEGTAVSWQTPYVDSGQPWVEKDYRFLGISAPVQVGLVTLTLYVDYNNVPSVSHTFDLNSGLTTQFFSVSQDTANGYACSLEITFETDVGATEPIELWSAFVGGTMRRGFTLKN